MRLPRFHSCTWSDEEQVKLARSNLHGPVRESPGSLADKELHLWVTYPTVKQAKRKGKQTKFPPRGRKAVGGDDHRGVAADRCLHL